jgi:hypothetical protein
MIHEPSNVFVGTNLNDTLTFPDIPECAVKSNSMYSPAAISGLLRSWISLHLTGYD